MCLMPRARAVCVQPFDDNKRRFTLLDTRDELFLRKQLRFL